MKPSQALDAHRTELRELVSRHGLLGARVFGSVLSGDDTDDSDLDRLVVGADWTDGARRLQDRGRGSAGRGGFRRDAERPAHEFPRRGDATCPSTIKRPHPDRVADDLGHITEAITRATGYIRPLPNIEAFETNPQVQDAVVRNIEIIGEAISLITRAAPGFTDQYPEIPWARMRAMRNVVTNISPWT